MLSISQFQNQLIRAASTPASTGNAEEEEEIGEVEIRKKETDEVKLTRDGALNQFISELSSNIHGRRYSESPAIASADRIERNVAVESTADSSSDVLNSENSKSTNIEANNKASDDVATGESDRRKSSDLLAKPSHFVTVIEVKESNSSSPTTAESTVSSTTSTSSSFKSIRSGYENVIIENNKRNSNLINEMDRSSNTSSFNSARPSAPIALIQDAKKKIPPR